LDPSAERRLTQLLSARAKGIFSDNEMAFQFGVLLESIGLDELLDRVSPDLVPLIKQGIVSSNQDAADAEYLRPQDSPFHGLLEYYHCVERILFDERSFGAPRKLRMICLPSFEPEWALVLIGSARAKYSAVVLCKVESQIWSTRNAIVTATRLEREVPDDVAAGLCDIWKKMLSNARHPKLMTVGCDGVSYHFEAGGMAARTWSPDPQTAPGKLVSLCDLLYQFAEGSLDKPVTIDEIRREIESLAAHCRARYGNE
jgi:hypothetical protein